MWRKLLQTSWYTIVLIIILVAIFVSAIRFYPDSYQNYLPEVQEKISTIVGRPVNVSSLRIGWKGISPHITVTDLSVYVDETKQERLLFVRSAYLSIDPYSSIFNKKIKINQLTLNGGNLRVVRKADHRIILNGIDISEVIVKRKKSIEKNKIHIELLGSTVDIKDEIKNLNYFFDRVNILFSIKDDKFKIASRFLLPEKLGESLTLTADIKDYDKDVNKLKGTLYTKGKNINLELISVFFPQLQLGIKSGYSDFEIWGDISSSLKRSFKGTLSFSELEYKMPEYQLIGIAENKEITEITSQFHIQGSEDDWHLALTDTVIQASDKKWSGEKYELSCSSCTKSNASVRAAFDYINLTNIFSTIQHFPIFAKSYSNIFEKLHVRGALKDLNLLTQFKNNKLEKYSFNTTFQSVALSIPSQQLELDSMTGKVSANHLKGKLDIDTRDLQIAASKIFNEPIENQHIVGKIKWRYDLDNTVIAFDNLSVITGNTIAEIQGLLQLNDEHAYVDIQGQMPKGDTQIIKKYLPYKKMNPKLATWLSESIKSGTVKDGKFLFRGNPRLFPFKNNPGVFEVFASLENGVLDYRKGWPSARNIAADLIIKNNLFVVNGSQGTILNSTVHQVEAKIEDLKLPRLVLNGNVSGDAGDILDFLQMSSLLPKNSQVPKYITADGNTNLDLNIILTLTRKLEKERIVNGIIEYEDVNLTVTSFDTLPFTNLNGKLNFNNEGAEGAGLSAKLYGSEFACEARRTDDGRTVLNLTGEFDFNTYFSSNYQQVGKYIKGSTPVNTTVNIPRFGKNVKDKSLELIIDASMIGAEINLPKPFNKQLDEQKNLYLNVKYEPGKGHPLYASFDNKIFVNSTFNREREKISAIEVRFGDDQFKLPDHGLGITGKLDQLDLMPWIELMPSTNGIRNIELTEIDIMATSITIYNLDFKNINFKLGKDAQSWIGTIESSLVKGEFSYPIDPSSEITAIGNFDYLRISKPEKKIDTAIDPRKLPSMLVNAKQFQLNNYLFQEVILKTEPSPNGMVIDSLIGNGDDLKITSSGAWEVDANSRQSTRIDMLLDSENLQNSITGLGYETQLSKGEGYVTAKLNWPAAPYQFSVESFLGTANIRFKDGEFASVKPGAGRFIGLVNLAEITKRLSLDFKDFFSKGYVFDKFRGDLVFKDANVTSDNLKIDGSSADILIQGRTGLIAKDYDQIITVTPHISGGLPWVGLAVGGPLGAVGVIVGEKVAETIGVDVDKVTQVKYSMKGTWEDPILEAISHKVEKTSPSAQGQPSPQQTLPSQAK